MTIIEAFLFLLFCLAVVVMILAFDWITEKISKWFDEH